MGGSTHTHTEGSKLAGISIQSSSLGQPIPIGWGRGKLSCNLGDYLNFTAVPHTTTTTSGGGGKGGGGSTTTDTTYTYTASVIMFICEGPITGIVTVYKDAATLSGVAAAGLNLYNGSYTQTPWSYLTSVAPDHALAYRGLAYVYAQDYDLGDSASLANHSFEVDFAVQLGGGVCDADPKDIVTDFLTNPNYGVASWPSAINGDWSDWSLYCRANNLLLSPVLSEAVSASDFLTRILDQCNSDCFFSEGLLKIRPLGDATATGNGVTWTPNLTPVYNITDDDYVEEPILEIVDQTDAYNHVQAEFLDRSNQYNTALATAYDLANEIQYGRRQADPYEFHDICDAQIARNAIQLKLQRVLYVRDLYHFDLPEDFILVEPMDYLSLTTTADELALVDELVRVIEIDEDEDGNDMLHFICEAVPDKVASAAQYAAHTSSGFKPDLEADPGNVATPIMFNAPTALVTSGFEAWAAVCGVNAAWGGANVWVSFDGTDYRMVGQVTAPARYGVLTANLADHADPDTANTLSVNLTASKGTLATVSHTDADNGASLVLIGSELIAYGDVALTSAYHYDLTYLRRGQRGSAHVAHSTGDTFIRLDTAILRIGYLPENAGATMHVKFQSFNYFGRGLQDLSTLTAYTLTLSPATSLPSAVTGLGLAGGGSTWTGSSIDLICDPAERATSYRFDVYKSDGTTLLRQIVSSTPSASYTSGMAASDGPQRSYKIAVTALNTGTGPTSAQISVTNAAPAALSSPSATGGTSTGQVTATVSSDTDLSGYVVFYSGTTGFDPVTSGGVVASGVVPLYIYGLPAGTYYAKIAAYDGWTANPSLLNLSTEQSFTITTGGGSTPSGGGTTGGGYTGGGRYVETSK